VPLLEAARDAIKMLARACWLGEERGNAVTLGGMQLASSLLRDKMGSVEKRQASWHLKLKKTLRGLLALYRVYS
jgi:hypothetical protein